MKTSVRGWVVDEDETIPGFFLQITGRDMQFFGLDQDDGCLTWIEKTAVLLACLKLCFSACH